uniref:Uncharacterized protein n=1 Tax=Myotis myotis TaxID=51298 RepID=A0A7J7VYK9_MYOMY|nr:hypothetical protein mMyoMyo1_012298 [Myotis myotis]
MNIPTSSASRSPEPLSSRQGVNCVPVWRDKRAWGGGGERVKKQRGGPLTVPCLLHVHSSLAAFAPSIPPSPSLPPKPTLPEKMCHSIRTYSISKRIPTLLKHLRAPSPSLIFSLVSCNCGQYCGNC